MKFEHVNSFRHPSTPMCLRAKPGLSQRQIGFPLCEIRGQVLGLPQGQTGFLSRKTQGSSQGDWTAKCMFKCLFFGSSQSLTWFFQSWLFPIFTRKRFFANFCAFLRSFAFFCVYVCALLRVFCVRPHLGTADFEMSCLFFVHFRLFSVDFGPQRPRICQMMKHKY